ncbi:hypothetical protein [Dictyobacter kobayashii]|uniref:Uncharacterized protein n=1 Tax=Dictyobacter kobayashii TaxID=2014872 RepID=A0A402ADS8_9CHLR|nr:hypothetical protein [Dictyobacter kobayashii]GCE17248.1 hypothetical protein KDK_10480 [Dictyobacter kobayashii]
MRNAAMERLSKLITDPPQRSRRGRVGEADSDRSLSIYFEDGWLSLFLLALLVYSVIWSVQAADWVDNLSVLTLSTFIALLLGLWSAKQQRFPSAWVYILVTFLGFAFAYWQMTTLFYNGSLRESVQGLQHWYSLVSISNFNIDNSAPFLLIVFLCFVLAYSSVLCLYRWRLPG